MKALFSTLLGSMLLTSLVGISYATPIAQPTQNADGNNFADNCQQFQGNPNYNLIVVCHGDSHYGRNLGGPTPASKSRLTSQNASTPNLSFLFSFNRKSVDDQFQQALRLRKD